jgi:hypothetical protein
MRPFSQVANWDDHGLLGAAEDAVECHRKRQ